MPSLNEKELTLLTRLSQTSAILSQRAIAEQSGISIGLINLVLHKLMVEGYVRASALNKKKIRYVLTPKGMKQLARRSYQKFIRTITQFQKMEGELILLFQELAQSSRTGVYLQGNGKLRELVEYCIKKKFRGEIRVVDNPDGFNGCGPVVILNLTERKSKKGDPAIDIPHYLAEKLKFDI